MNKKEKIKELRYFVARYGLPPERPALPLGVAAADAALGGGLQSGALHEIYASDWGAGGFAACLAIRLAGKKPVFWIRPDYEALEYGGLSAQGWAELGGDPRALFLIRTANAAEALSAAHDILGCAHVGALLLEISGHPAALDMVAGQRLNFAASESGVTPILLREGADAFPSAAQTRWHAASASSDEADWGLPTFRAELARNRQGPTGAWTMTWDPDNGLFQQSAYQHHAPHPGALAAVSFDRSAPQERRIAF
jgi:protein ImuA